MHLTTDDELNSLREVDMIKYLKDINEYNLTNYDAETLKQKLKAFQRTRYTIIRHVCSTTGGH